MPCTKPGLNRLASPRQRNNIHPCAPGPRWTPIPKPSKPKRTTGTRAVLRSRSRAFRSEVVAQGMSDGESYHDPTENASSYRVNWPPRIEKEEMADDGSYYGRNKRSLPLDEPTSSKPSSGLQSRRGVDTLLNNIMQNSGFNSQPQTRGYRSPMVEDVIDTESDYPVKAQESSPTGPVLKRTSDVSMTSGSGPSPRTSDVSMTDGSDSPERASDVSMTDDIETSPGIRPEKRVHWADDILGPSGTGYPGANVPTKSALTAGQHVLYSTKVAENESPSKTSVSKNSKSTHNEAAEAEVPSPFLTSHYPSSQNPPPKKSNISGTTSFHPTQLPTPPSSPRRSPRFQNTQSASTHPHPTSEPQTTAASLAHPPPRAAPSLPADSSLSNALIKEELAYLRSKVFDPRSIRPVPDLSQVFNSLTGAFGEPGTGILQTRFVPPSPRHATSTTGAGKIERRKEYRGRRYSMNPILKSRRLEIELLKVRVSHAMLLSFNLASDARRDAINIGDLAEFSVGPGADLSGRSLFRALDREDRNTSGVGKSKDKSHPGAGILSGRSGNRRRNSNKDTWIIGKDGSRKRRRESDGDLESREKERRANLNKKMARAADEGDSKALAEASREMSSGSSDSVGAGTMRVMFWRLIRVSAIVEVDVKTRGRVGVEKMEEVQSAWWAVPEKAIIGMF